MASSVMIPPQSPTAIEPVVVGPQSEIRIRGSRSGLRTRIMAFGTLCGVMGGFGFVGLTVYEAVRDSFIAPAILSPESDIVMNSKLKVDELEVERVRAAAEVEGIDADLAAAEQAVTRLDELKRAGAKAVGWTTAITAQKTLSTTSELKALDEQKSVIGGMIEEQKTLTEKAESDLQSGLISKSEYARDRQALDQLQLALLDNNRAILQGQSALGEAALAHQALSSQGRAPLTPELLTRQEQMIRVDLEIVHLNSEKRAKVAQKRALEQRIAKVDELAAQLKGRPIYKAAEQSLEVAFVPYTQIDGVSKGAAVYSCVWGIFLCKPVGKVSEIVSGEVILPDPWGNQARGQYAVLDLVDHDAARAKTLRVRGWANPSARESTRPDMSVSAR